jgi:hypothetical protein
MRLVEPVSPIGERTPAKRTQWISAVLTTHRCTKTFMLKSSSLLFVMLAACARHLPMPLTAAQLAEQPDGRALVVYLGQRDASAAVCDLDGTSPHIAAVDADVRRAMMNGLLDDRIAPPVWRDCMDRLVRTTDSESAMSLLDEVAREYDRTLMDGRAERDSVVEQRLSALQTLLVDGRGEIGPHADVMVKLLADVRAATASRRLGPIGMRDGAELMADVASEQGVRNGRTIDVATLDALLQSHDEATLRRYARRLPDAGRRVEARRRVIRLHIQASPYPAVRRNAAAIEETLMRLGANPVALAEHRPVRASVDLDALAARGILVRQDLLHQTSTLLGNAGDGNAVSVLPEVSLRGALQIELEGIGGLVTLCASPEALDPSPCVAAQDVTLDSRLATLEPDGTLRFIERLTSRETAALARAGGRVVVPIMIRGQRLASLDWSLQFETPKDLVLGSTNRDGNGPDLHVRVEWLDTGRLTYIVGRGEAEYQAIVERPQASMFHVISRGADGLAGADGSRGHDGMAGSTGSSATCPSFNGSNGGRGEDGGPGEDGASGGSGGRGGDIVVDVAYHGEEGDKLVALLRTTMQSNGGSAGAGGSGGVGGSGGAGGSGGSGATCFDTDGRASTLSGGSPGLSGTDGRSGFPGTSGANGQPGRVTVRVVE